MILGVEVIDIVGYLGTLIVILSFMCKDMITLRFVSILGCVVFMVYSIFKGDVPILLTNIAIIAVNIYWLIKEYREN